MSTPRGQIAKGLPEQGQLVEVRRRQWIVGEVSTGTLQTDSRDNGNALVTVYLYTKADAKSRSRAVPFLLFPVNDIHIDIVGTQVWPTSAAYLTVADETQT